MIKIEKNDLLDLILCADFYDFGHDVLYAFLFEKIGEISDKDIEKYVNENYSSETEEEKEDSNIKKDVLKNLRDYYTQLEEINLDN